MVDVSFGVEDVGPAERQLEGLEPTGVLVEQEPQVGRRLVGCRDCEQHHPNSQDGFLMSDFDAYCKGIIQLR